MKSCSILGHRKIEITPKLKNLIKKTYFHDKKLVTNNFSYIKRNEMLVDKSDICIFYYNPNYVLEKNTKSGTKIAYEYAIKKHKQIINLYL